MNPLQTFTRQGRNLLFTCLCLTAPALFSATFTVSHTGRADFTDLQTAINTASPGDTLMVEGNGVSYGDIFLTKRLIIYGQGYFLDQNPGLSSALTPTSIGDLYVREGPDSSPEGSIINSMTAVGNVFISSSRITLKRCRVLGSTYTDYSDANDAFVSTSENTFIGCWFEGGVSAYMDDTHSSTDLLFVGCIFRSAYQGFAQHNVSGQIKNCIIAGQHWQYGFRNFNFLNTIFEGGPGVMINCTAHYCIGLASGELPGSNNLYLDTPDGVFLGGLSSDGKYQLAEGSPAIGAGMDGADCGVYWNNLYVLSGIPALPTIARVDMPLEVSNRRDLEVTVDVRVQP